MRWTYLTPEAAVAEELQKEAGLSPLMARLLALRGVSEPAQAAAFLSPSLSQLHSPYLMRGMHEAIERICAAIANASKRSARCPRRSRQSAPTRR